MAGRQWLLSGSEGGEGLAGFNEILLERANEAVGVGRRFELEPFLFLGFEAAEFGLAVTDLFGGAGAVLRVGFERAGNAGGGRRPG